MTATAPPRAPLFADVSRLAMAAARARGLRGLTLDELRAVRDVAHELEQPEPDPDLVEQLAGSLGIPLHRLVEARGGA